MRLKMRASKQFIAAKAIRYDVDNHSSMSRRESRRKWAFTLKKIVVANVFFCAKSFCFDVYRLPAHSVLSGRFSPCRDIRNLLFINRLQQPLRRAISLATCLIEQKIVCYTISQKLRPDRTEGHRIAGRLTDAQRGVCGRSMPSCRRYVAR